MLSPIEQQDENRDLLDNIIAINDRSDYSMTLEDLKDQTNSITTSNYSSNPDDLNYKIINEILNDDVPSNQNMPFTKYRSHRQSIDGNFMIRNQSSPQPNRQNCNKNNNQQGQKFPTQNRSLMGSEEKISQEKIDQIKIQMEQTETQMSKLRQILAKTKPVSEKFTVQQQLLYIENYKLKNFTQEEMLSIRENKECLVKKLKKDLSVFQEYQANRLRNYQQQSDQIKMKYNPQLEVQQRALQEISQMEQNAQIQLKKSKEAYQQLEENQCMLKEDLTAQIMLRAELVAQREELEQLLDDLKSKNPIEFNFFNDQYLIKQKKVQLATNTNVFQQEKIKLILQQQEIAKKLYEVNDQCYEQNGRLNTLSKNVLSQGLFTHVERLKESPEQYRLVLTDKHRLAQYLTSESLHDNQIDLIHEYMICEYDQEQKEQSLKQYKLEKAKIDELINKKDTEYQKDFNIIKQLENQLTLKKQLLEQNLNQQADQAFKDYLESQISTFESLQRTYGTKAANQIKQEHLNQFFEIMKSNQKKILSRCQFMHEEYNRINQLIAKNEKIVDSELLLERDSNHKSQESVKLQIAKRIEELNVIAQKRQLYELKLDELRSLKEKEISEIKVEEKITNLEAKIANLQTQIQEIQTEIDLMDTNMNQDELLNSIQLSAKSKQLKELERKYNNLELEKITLEQKLVEQSYQLFQPPPTNTSINPHPQFSEETQANLNKPPLPNSQNKQIQSLKRNLVSDFLTYSPLQVPQQSQQQQQVKVSKAHRRSFSQQIGQQNPENIDCGKRSPQIFAWIGSGNNLSSDDEIPIQVSECNSNTNSIWSMLEDLKIHQPNEEALLEAPISIQNDHSESEQQKAQTENILGENRRILNTETQKPSQVNNEKQNKFISDQGFIPKLPISQTTKNQPSRDTNPFFISSQGAQFLKHDNLRTITEENFTTQRNQKEDQNNNPVPITNQNFIKQRKILDFVIQKEVDESPHKQQPQSLQYSLASLIEARKQRRTKSNFQQENLNTQMIQNLPSKAQKPQQVHQNYLNHPSNYSSVNREEFNPDNFKKQKPVHKRAKSVESIQSLQTQQFTQISQPIQNSTNFQQNHFLQQKQDLKNLKQGLKGGTNKQSIKLRSPFSSTQEEQVFYAPAYNPLQNENYTYEQCGYGQRICQLDLGTLRLEFKQKNRVDLTIPITQIGKIQLHPTSQQILKFQNHFEIFKLTPEEKIALFEKLKSQLNHETNNQFTCNNLEKILNCQNYPFSILIDKGQKIELIAPDHDTIQIFQNSIENLIHNKKIINSLRVKVQIIRKQ